MSMTVLIAVLVFTGVILLLVTVLNYANSKLVNPGPFKLDINKGQKEVEVEGGKTVLSALSDEGIFLPSACGGGGTCAMCKCRVTEGGGAVLPTEEGHLSRIEKRNDVRLGCQVKVKDHLKIEVPQSVFGIRKFKAKLKSNRNVATFMKEFIFETDPADNFTFEPGAYIQFHMPPCGPIDFKDMQVEDKFKGGWDSYKLWDLKCPARDEECVRAYSLANMPAEKNIAMCKIRIATPPGSHPDAPPGFGSSYMFAMKPGDEIVISGPYGDFFLKDTDREICFIGGGAGMGPMRSHIFHLFHTLKTKRKVTFWYGARSVREMCWCNDFVDIDNNNENFTYRVALSDPEPEDKWDGSVGFIHKVALEEYLSKHKDPGSIEYYLCGPPPMVDAVVDMLDSLGVEDDMIAYDSFS
jgi:Na+-transporting NADH:ubiquinone oxidoreductase subunit F